MTFAHPWLLLLLLLLPPLAWLKGRRGAPPAFVYSSVQLVRAMQNISRSRAGGFLGSLRWLLLAVLIVALAQPRLSKSTTEVKASGVDIVVALDLSGSMESPDFVVNGKRVDRLDMAKMVLSQFIDMRPNDRIGLVAFGGRAYIASPLTLDHEFLQENVTRLHLHMIEDNTAIGSALATAANRLRDLKAKSKIVILMTDGGNNAGTIEPLDAAAAAKVLGVKVYTVGVGNNEVAMQIGRPDWVPDEDTLRKIADLTGGKYYRADNAERFRQIYAEIDRLEKTEATISKYTEFKELFAWLAGCGLALLLLEIVLGQTAFRRLP
jgi:Ca-activated chloride channel family protein